jgi:hypothetical protein
MTQYDSLGGGSAGMEQPVNSFDLRHPSNLELRLTIEGIKNQQRAALTVGYVLLQKSMEDFFAAGHSRPEYGDESY